MRLCEPVLCGLTQQSLLHWPSLAFIGQMAKKLLSLDGWRRPCLPEAHQALSLPHTSNQATCAARVGRVHQMPKSPKHFCCPSPLLVLAHAACRLMGYTHTHAHMHTRANTHTHTHTRRRAPTLPPCSLGLKGMDPANTEKLESLILTKLEELEKSGFSDSAVEAAINTIEFRCGSRSPGLEACPCAWCAPACFAATSSRHRSGPKRTAWARALHRERIPWATGRQSHGQEPGTGRDSNGHRDRIPWATSVHGSCCARASLHASPYLLACPSCAPCLPPCTPSLFPGMAFLPACICRPLSAYTLPASFKRRPVPVPCSLCLCHAACTCACAMQPAPAPAPCSLHLRLCHAAWACAMQPAPALVPMRLRPCHAACACTMQPAPVPVPCSLRENNTGSFPRGLSLMLRAMNAWIYDRDPLVPLQVCARARARARECACVPVCAWVGACLFAHVCMGVLCVGFCTSPHATLCASVPECVQEQQQSLCFSKSTRACCAHVHMTTCVPLQALLAHRSRLHPVRFHESNPRLLCSTICAACASCALERPHALPQFRHGGVKQRRGAALEHPHGPRAPPAQEQPPVLCALWGHALGARPAPGLQAGRRSKRLKRAGRGHAVSFYRTSAEAEAGRGCIQAVCAE